MPTPGQRTVSDKKEMHPFKQHEKGGSKLPADASLDRAHAPTSRTDARRLVPAAVDFIDDFGKEKRPIAAELMTPQGRHQAYVSAETERHRIAPQICLGTKGWESGSIRGT